MRTILRVLLSGMAGVTLALTLSGCGTDNEGSMAGTKGVAPPNAPKSQAEYFKQQQELSKDVNPKAKSAKSK